MKLFRKLSYLTSSEVSSFNENGFLYLKDKLPLIDIAKIRQQAHDLIESWEPVKPSIFTTNEQSRISDKYFMDSAHNISFFLEEGVKPPIADKQNSVNKIGHALHDLDPVFRKFSYRPEYKAALHDLGYKTPVIVQSMYIVKGPKIGGEVKAHQDGSYQITTPSSVIGIWVALEDANVTNACMYAIPGSQKLGPMQYWEKINEEMMYTNGFEYDKKGAVLLEAKAGTVILFHGSLVHWSEQNYSNKSRHAYTLHAYEGELEWSEKNWIQRPSHFPFRKWE